MPLPQPEVKVSSIIMNEGKVLIGRAPDGLWETPTVSIDPFEGMKDAAIRAALANTGVVSEPQNVLFVSEVVKQKEAVHKVLIYLYAKYISDGEEFIYTGWWTEAVWADVKELGQYQDEMSDETADAFYKFSMILRQSAARGAQG